MSKKKAFLIHLGASLLVFSILLMLIIYFWYPAPYFDMEYRMKWIALIAFVDVVLGPGLTLLIFKADKPNIKFDMSVILIFQISALSWGVWTAWNAHPLTNVYFDGTLYCMDRKDVKAAGVDSNIVAYGLTDKIMLTLPYPETNDEKREYLDRFVKDIPLVFTMGDKLEVTDKHMTTEFLNDQKGFDVITNANAENQRQWKQFTSQYENINPDWRYIDFKCFEGDRVIVLDRKNNKIQTVFKMSLPVNWNL